MRIVIDDVRPTVDCSRHAVKRTVGEVVDVSAIVISHGHDIVRAELLFRKIEPADAELAGVPDTPSRKPARTRARKAAAVVDDASTDDAGGADVRWSAVPMERVETDPDRVAATFQVPECGQWEFTVRAWIDHLATWRDELRRKVDAGRTELSAELTEGAALLGVDSLDVRTALAPAPTEPERRDAETTSPVRQRVEVDPLVARFSAWYELFPRSFGGLTGVRALLPQIVEDGFDVLYLTPIHPIGVTNRKGRDNSPVADPGDPGSPWAIGSADGGHCAIEPALGTFADFDALVKEADAHDVAIALDLAYQCSPDHPWLQEHPDWFAWRPDGTIKYAENPPKRYEDIVNFDFETTDRIGLWTALRDVVSFWVGHGVRVFRVDNPHTKPFDFWEWMIADIRATHPEVVFLAEAFTTPARMQLLAKLGFNQSYTYYTWRNTRREIEEYVTELAAITDYFRPNFFANTPDILHEYLQHGGPAAFDARLVLAATLSPSYGIYSGFETFENEAVRAGSEEYADSEKYASRQRTLDGPLLERIAIVNRIRRECDPFHHLDNVTFLDSRHEDLIAYVKRSPSETVVVCVNLNPHTFSEGLLALPPELELPSSFQVVDLLDGGEYRWRTGDNYVLLSPGSSHIMRIRP
jgi:starch synthase (maltosyl-transferring)